MTRRRFHAFLSGSDLPSLTNQKPAAHLPAGFFVDESPRAHRCGVFCITSDGRFEPELSDAAACTKGCSGELLEYPNRSEPPQLTNVVFKFLSRLIDLARRRNANTSEWYKVGFDGLVIWRIAHPPGRESFKDEIEWTDISRVIFEASYWAQQDSIYIFTRLRPESYLIPTDASGADELWHEIIKRGLFDSNLGTEAALSKGGFYCWPPENE